MHEYHIPVLAQESTELLAIRLDGTYADLTFGGGGHSSLILSQLGERGRLYSFDQDADAKANAARIEDSRFTFIESNFRFLRGQLRLRGVAALDGVFADLGVSSHHFDTPERGFSFRYDTPLDMRMNRRAGVTAADILNTYDTERLATLLGRWGELQTPYKIANCIERARNVRPIATVSDLTAAVAPCTPKKDETKFLSKLFQALRIEVNGEMRALEMALEQSLKMLRPGGRLVIISYHSLEDRLVKNFMRSGTFSGEAEKDFFGNTASPFRPVTRKAVVPTEQEIKENPRSRSARLRAAEKKE
ncbi:MAG: 16S rRNA (cytosine(1402)-N(4))-methyltransferase RsmH [Alistipes inops]